MSVSIKDEKDNEKHKMYNHTGIEFPQDDILPVRTSTGHNQRKKNLGERPIKSSQQIYRNPFQSRSGSKKGDKNEKDNFQKSIEKFEEGRMSDYKHEEEGLNCYRFPHLNFCACKPDPCKIQIKDPFFVEVLSQMFVGSFAAAFSTKLLLRAGITHVVNLSGTEYTKRTKYFKYLNIDVYETSEEDIKKFFRLTNRFIFEARKSNGKVFIHCQTGKSIALAFAIAYLIGLEKLPLKISFEGIKKEIPDISIPSYFYKQLEQYDLEKLVMIKNGPSEND